MTIRLWLCLVSVATSYSFASAFMPDEGIYDATLLKDSNPLDIPRSFYKGSEVFLEVYCENGKSNLTIKIAVTSPCWGDADPLTLVHGNVEPAKSNHSNAAYTYTTNAPCTDHVVVYKDKPFYTIPQDGIYQLTVYIDSETDFQAHVNIKMKSHYGYLSAVDWPCLPFYGFMSIFYVIIGLIWLLLSFMQWRDLLRVQFWIGGVILLGMLEKATFYAEYQSINNTGLRVQGAMLFAAWVSCAKRTLARMLVIIVSLGYGIVKPRLGASLHRVVGVGSLYFFLAASEAYLRVTQPKNPRTKDVLVASVPLAVLDSAICWWIFSALINTMRTLRLRRNEVKLSLYKHFTNTLIFAVIASVIYMLYWINHHDYHSCSLVWKHLWLDDGYWHILFSALLLVIMILWRPTNNNQRYAFVPLLETIEDEEEEQLVKDAFGVKVRIHHPRPTSPKANTVEEDIKWLEENVKSDPVMTFLDSDEELVNTRFEVSKMQ